MISMVLMNSFSRLVYENIILSHMILACQNQIMPGIVMGLGGRGMVVVCLPS